MNKGLKEMSNLQKQVFMLIPRGIDNLISTQEIEDILGIDKRYIMGIVEALIVEHEIPIGSLRQSNNYGYFIATNEEEKRLGIYSMVQQINTMKKRVKRVKEADLTKTLLYKEKYKAEITKRKQQSNIYEYLNKADETQLERI